MATTQACRRRGVQALRGCIQNTHGLLPINARVIPGLIVATIVRGQAYRLAYWIAWHLALGAERLVIFDNGANYNLSSLLSDRVEVRKMHGHNMQIVAYDAAIETFRNRSDDCFLACWDVDEFLLPMGHDTLSDEVVRCRRTPACAGLRYNTLVSEGMRAPWTSNSSSPLWNVHRGTLQNVVKTIVRVSHHGRWRTPHATFPQRGCVMDEHWRCPNPPNMPFYRKPTATRFAVLHLHCTTEFDWIVKKSTTGRIDESTLNRCSTCRGSWRNISHEYVATCTRPSSAAISLAPLTRSMDSLVLSHMEHR